MTAPSPATSLISHLSSSSSSSTSTSTSIMPDFVDTTVLQYWLQWQVAVCALIIATSTVASLVAIKRARPEPLRSEDLWLPCWRGMHPLWLLGFRVLAMVVMCWVLYDILLLFGPAVFYFYTMWTFVLVIIYFAIATMISAYSCWKYSKRTVQENEEAKGFIRRNLKKKSQATLTSGADGNKKRIESKGYAEQGHNLEKAGFCGHLMLIVYQTSGGAAMLTDIVFWCILLPFMPSDVFTLNLVMILMHSINAVFLLLDTALNRLDFPWFRMAYFVLWSCIYVTIHWILHALGSTWWPYPFLELATPVAPLWYLGMALIHLPCYGLYYLIAKAKNSYFPKGFTLAHLKAH